MPFPEEAHACQRHHKDRGHAEAGVHDHRREILQRTQEESGREIVGHADEQAEHRFPQANPFLFPHRKTQTQYQRRPKGTKKKQNQL